MIVKASRLISAIQFRDYIEIHRFDACFAFLLLFIPKSSQDSSQIIQFAGQCLLVALRILLRFLAGARYGRNVPRQFDLAEGCTTCPFHSFSPHPSTIFALFSLCLYFAGAAVICCDKAASTGDARVSRVEGHAPSFPTRVLFRAPSARQGRSEESL